MHGTFGTELEFQWNNGLLTSIGSKMGQYVKMLLAVADQHMNRASTGVVRCPVMPTSIPWMQDTLNEKIKMSGHTPVANQYVTKYMHTEHPAGNVHGGGACRKNS